MLVAERRSRQPAAPWRDGARRLQHVIWHATSLGRRHQPAPSRPTPHAHLVPGDLEDRDRPHHPGRSRAGEQLLGPGRQALHGGRLQDARVHGVRERHRVEEVGGTCVLFFFARRAVYIESVGRRIPMRKSGRGSACRRWRGQRERPALRPGRSRWWRASGNAARASPARSADRPYKPRRPNRRAREARGLVVSPATNPVGKRRVWRAISTIANADVAGTRPEDF